MHNADITGQSTTIMRNLRLHNKKLFFIIFTIVIAIAASRLFLQKTVDIRNRAMETNACTAPQGMCFVDIDPNQIDARYQCLHISVLHNGEPVASADKIIPVPDRPTTTRVTFIADINQSYRCQVVPVTCGGSPISGCEAQNSVADAPICIGATEATPTPPPEPTNEPQGSGQNNIPSLSPSPTPPSESPSPLPSPTPSNTCAIPTFTVRTRVNGCQNCNSQ